MAYLCITCPLRIQPTLKSEETHADVVTLIMPVDTYINQQKSREQPLQNFGILPKKV